jgi:hypothetical protein
MVSDRTARRLVGAVLVSLAVLAPAAPARAQAVAPSAADKETARSLMDQGDDKMEAKRHAEALKAYQAADAIMHLPMTGVAVARAQAAVGMLIEALDKAREVAATVAGPGESPFYARARTEAAALVIRITARIPSIRIDVAAPPAGLVVSIDGTTLPPAAATEPRKVNPGKHEVVVSAPGFEPSRATVNAREGETLPVPLTLLPRPGGPLAVPPVPNGPTAPTGGTSPLVYLGFGLGGAGLVVGAITGGLSLAKTGTIKGTCSAAGVCPLAQQDAIAGAKTLANVSNVTLGVGVAGVVLGVVGVVLSKPKAQAPASAWVEPLLGPGVIGVRGTF